MTRNQWWHTTCALTTVAGLLSPTALLAAGVDGLTFGPRSGDVVAARLSQQEHEVDSLRAYVSGAA